MKTINLLTFGTKYNQQPIADLVYSCKRFPNPHSEYPSKNGLSPEVKEYVLANHEALEFLRTLNILYR
jgi:RNase adaptor protein for sRNA GlmZ degradation